MQILKRKYMRCVSVFAILVDCLLTAPIIRPQPSVNTPDLGTNPGDFDVILERMPKTYTFYSPSHSHSLTLHTFTSLLPIESASLALLELYTKLAYNASGPWISIPTASSFTACCGNLYIDFEASNHYGVPWSFVAAFARKMIMATNKGFTGRFEGEYRHLGSEAVIRVTLRYVMVAAAA